MSLEDTASTGESKRLAACVKAVRQYLSRELDSLLRAARKSLIYAAHESPDQDEEDRLFAPVEEVEALAPVAGEAFRNAVLSRLKPSDESQSDDASVDDGAGLTLVDTGKVDDWLRMREIVERHTDEANALESGLCARLAEAAGIVSNPDNATLSVPGLCALFHASVRNLDAGHEARAALYDAFEATVVANFGNLVDELYFILDAPSVPKTPRAGKKTPSFVTPEPESKSAPANSLLPTGSDAEQESDTAQQADQATSSEPESDEASVEPVRLLGAITSIERQMLDMSTGRGLEGLAELEARLTAALTPPGKPLSEPKQRAVAAVAGLVHQAFAHPGIDPAVRARLWKLAPPLALIALQDDDQLDLVLQATRHDPVTGLLDRTAFRVRLEAALANTSEGNRGFAVCFVGVDGFEGIGQQLGQQIAGRLLRVLADLMRRSAGMSAHLARLRGAEFAVLVAARHSDTGWRFANRYLAAVNKANFAVAGHEMTPTVSIGVVESDHALTTVAQVMQAADAAHKAAKDDGGDCARVYIPEGFG
jgi:diguanylate cyclase (GGDEF)-like protein